METFSAILPLHATVVNKHQVLCFRHADVVYESSLAHFIHFFLVSLIGNTTQTAEISSKVTLFPTIEIVYRGRKGSTLLHSRRWGTIARWCVSWLRRISRISLRRVRDIALLGREGRVSRLSGRWSISESRRWSISRGTKSTGGRWSVSEGRRGIARGGVTRLSGRGAKGGSSRNGDVMRVNSRSIRRDRYAAH